MAKSPNGINLNDPLAVGRDYGNELIARGKRMSDDKMEARGETMLDLASRGHSLQLAELIITTYREGNDPTKVALGFAMGEGGQIRHALKGAAAHLGVPLSDYGVDEDQL